MFKKMGLKGKVYLIIGLPLLGLLLFVGNNLYDKFTILSSTKDIDMLVKFGQQSSALVHELQEERGVSAGFIGSNGKSFADVIGTRRNRTDDAHKVWKEQLAGFEPKSFGEEFAKNVEGADSEFARLKGIRDGISGLNVSAAEMLGFFSTLNKLLLAAIHDIALVSTDAQITQLLLAYTNLLEAKERAGIENAVIGNVFASGAITSAEFLTFNSLISLQDTFLGEFEDFASEKQKAAYSKLSQERYVAEVERMRGVVLAKIQKDEILNKISSEIGYGGLIHQFKNLVIRGQEKFADRSKARFDTANGFLDQYLALPGVSEVEKEKIEDIRGVISQYNDNVNLVMAQVKKGASVKAIDGSVKINDGPALNAIAFLQKGNFGIESGYWFDQATQRINMLKSMDDMVSGDIVQVADDLYASTMTAFITLSAVAVAILLATLLFGFFITRSLLKSVNQLIQQLFASSNQTLSASEQLAASSLSLSEGASEQAASLEETSSTVEELNSMTKENAENAGRVDTLSGSAGEAAKMGVEAMQRMILAINEIKSSSDETAKIIKTIDEIAFQTNLLALNAAVEAARAGDAGRGFAVVAEEVRNLAQRSAEAARSTSEMIEGSQQRADNGVSVGAEVDSALGQINASIAEVTTLIKEVAQASNEQARGLDQVSTALAQMDQVTQGNAAGAQENSASSEELTSQAQMLQGVVDSLAGLIYGAGDRGAMTRVASGNGVEIEPALTNGNSHSAQIPTSPRNTLRAAISKENTEETSDFLPKDFQDLEDEDFKSM